MRCACARHPYEDGVGVCAPCLRDRLLALAVEQNEASSLPPPPPPEPVFPRSVSPYVYRPPGLNFFRTPQVGPAYGAGVGFKEGDIGIRRRRSGRFSVLAALFGHRSEEKEKCGARAPKHRSWLAGLMPRSREKKKVPEPPSPPRCSCSAINDTGLSPVRYVCGDGAQSAFRAESPSPLRKSPCRRLLADAGAGVSGFAVCISPLVRPSPGRHHRGDPTPDATAVCSELHPSPLHGLASGTSHTHCRSWNLADGGRFR